jgi:hypothetical protein
MYESGRTRENLAVRLLISSATLCLLCSPSPRGVAAQSDSAELSKGLSRESGR